MADADVAGMQNLHFTKSCDGVPRSSRWEENKLSELCHYKETPAEMPGLLPERKRWLPAASIKVPRTIYRPGYFVYRANTE